MKTVITVLFVGLIGLASVARADDATTIKSKDGSLQMVLPPGWIAATDLNNHAVLQAKNPDANDFVVCLADLRTVAPTLEDYAKVRVKAIEQKLADVKVDGPKKKQIGGNNALQYQIRGTVVGEVKVKAGYVVTLIQTKKYYLLVLSWTTAAHFDDQKDALAKIAEQVSEVK